MFFCVVVHSIFSAVHQNFTVAYTVLYSSREQNSLDLSNSKRQEMNKSETTCVARMEGFTEYEYRYCTAQYVGALYISMYTGICTDFYAAVKNMNFIGSNLY